MPSAVIYARYSSASQRDASIEDQVRVCREWCAREGYEVMAVYSDKAMSGRTDDRPGFQRMIANAGESDIVLVYMMDRFSRDPYDAPLYKHMLAKEGVRLVSALEAIPDSPEGVIYEKLLEGLAACESRKTSIRTKRGMHGNALKCMTNGQPLFGYRADASQHYAIFEPEAAVVREIFALRIAGSTCNAIAAALNSRGLRKAKGRPFSASSIYNLLRNAKYAGVYSWGDVEVDGGMPAIVDKQTFQEAQDVRPKKQRKNEEWADYTLSGRVVCAVCGSVMAGRSAYGKLGKRYEYYACKNRCLPYMRRDSLESGIAVQIRELMQDRAEALRIASEAISAATSPETDARRENAAAAIRQADRALEGLLEAMESGLHHPSMQARIDELTARKAQAEAELALLEASLPTAEQLADFLQADDGMTDAELLDAFVHSAIVSDDGIVVALNYTRCDEPAKLNVSRVRMSSAWGTACKLARTSLAGGMWLIRL